MDLRLASKEQPGRPVNTARREIKKSQAAPHLQEDLGGVYCYTGGSHNERVTSERWKDQREGPSALIQLEKKKKNLFDIRDFPPSN